MKPTAAARNPSEPDALRLDGRRENEDNQQAQATRRRHAERDRQGIDEDSHQAQARAGDEHYSGVRGDGGGLRHHGFAGPFEELAQRVKGRAGGNEARDAFRPEEREVEDEHQGDQAAQQ